MLSLYLLTAFPWLGLAWTNINPFYIPSTRRPFIYSQSTSAIFQARLQSIYQGPEEDEECANEEECEINWDLMPSGDDDDEEEDESESDSLAEDEATNVGRMATTPVRVARDEVASEMVALQGSRVRLEVNWQIDECKTDHDSCEDFCPECAGAGKMPCRFCRGTNMLSLNNEFKPCPVCNQGKEICGPCRGTGKIAPWATTMDNHIHKKMP